MFNNSRCKINCYVMITSSAFSSSPFLFSPLLPSRSPGKTSDPDFNHRDELSLASMQYESQNWSQELPAGDLDVVADEVGVGHGDLAQHVHSPLPGVRHLDTATGQHLSTSPGDWGVLIIQSQQIIVIILWLDEVSLKVFNKHSFLLHFSWKLDTNIIII